LFCVETRGITFELGNVGQAVKMLSPPDAPRRPADPHSLLKSLLAAGEPLAIGSDGGADLANPFLNIMLACTYAASPGEALSREQALLAYTTAGAYAERQERSKGRVMPGMHADLAVPSQDILTVPAQALPGTTSVLTLVDGEIVFEASAWVDAAPSK
jgi:predicted amidohydrolase YtcJ